MALKHAAIIMDGNNRWAAQRGKSGISGHRAGVENIRAVMEVALEQGIECLTLFAFSSENWRRPTIEVDALMRLFNAYLEKEAGKLADEGVQLKVIGRRDRFSKTLLQAIQRAESITANQRRCRLVIAADYGGCWDITQACRSIAELAADKAIAASEINEALVSEHLTTAGFPDLDLLIRTGGDQRISNFLLWQAAYAELVFSDTLWPDFTKEHMSAAIEEFYRRERRFGHTSDQLKSATNTATSIR